MTIKSTQSNNSPEAIKNYSTGWDVIFGRKDKCWSCKNKKDVPKPGDRFCKRCLAEMINEKVRSSTSNQEERSSEPDMDTGTPDSS